MEGEFEEWAQGALDGQSLACKHDDDDHHHHTYTSSNGSTGTNHNALRHDNTDIQSRLQELGPSSIGGWGGGVGGLNRVYLEAGTRVFL